MLARPTALLVGTVFALLVLGASSAQALEIQCCTQSSDFGEPEDPTDPAQLAATFDYVVTDLPTIGDDLFTLTLSVTNDTPVSGIDASFNINAIFFNAVLDVLSVTLVSVTDEGAGDVTGSWGAQTGPGGGAGWELEKAESIGGFDDFMYSLWEGTGIKNPSVIQPGETTVFVFEIEAATGATIDMDSFDTGFINNQGNEVSDSPMGAKFVSCSGSDCVAPDDSAFGSGVIPEPGTGLLLGLGLVGLGSFSRRSRRTR